MPNPNPDESESDFVVRYMGSEEAKKSFPDEKQRLAVAYSAYREHNKNKKKEMLCLKGLEKKENGKYKALLATTHPDRVGDILSVNALKQIETFINGNAVGGTVGSYTGLSLFHDWVEEKNPSLPEAGFMSNAQVVTLSDGHKGVQVDVEINKYCNTDYKGEKYDAERIIYEIENNRIGGLSIEYREGNTKQVDYNGTTYNYIDSLAEFGGGGFARSRMIANPHAVILKEIELKIMKEANTMDETKEVPNIAVNISTPLETKEEKKEPVVEVKETKKEASTFVDSIAVKEMISNAVREGISKIDVKTKPLHNEGEAMDMKLKEMNEAIAKGDTFSFKEMAKELIDKELDSMHGQYKFDSQLNVKCDGKGMRIVGGLKVKGTLDTSTNASTYTQASVEFADLFAPGIIDTFNNQTNLFGFLRKEQHLGGTHYQWKMVTNQNPDSNSTFVDRDDVTVLKNYANKSNYQTPIKIARRGVSVTDFTLRYSAASLGDLFQLEVQLQTNKMMTDIDAALFAEMADGTGNAPLGLEAVSDSAGNTTIYGLTRSTANRLSPTSAVNTYTVVGGNVSEGQIRAYVDQLLIEGTQKDNIALIVHPTIRSYLYNLLDGQRQFITTEAAFGFNKKMVDSYDGFPIIVDHNCESSSIFVIDQESDVIVMAMEPRLVSLAKVGAATEGYVEMHFAHVYKQPRRIGQLKTITGPVA